MAIAHYLAMTADEMSAIPLPRQAAWMACHFSPYSTGLCNFPVSLPEGSLLILNDRTPLHGHDPQRIAQELAGLMQQFSCAGLLLDFQNSKTAEADALVLYLSGALHCPMAFSQEYAPEGAAVFLPPIPTDVSPAEYLAPWKQREVWLETALEGQNIRLTKDGAVFSRNSSCRFPRVHAEPALHCHYAIEEEPDSVIFHTWRTAEDLNALLADAEALGVQNAVGLFQEMQPSGIIDG